VALSTEHLRANYESLKAGRSNVEQVWAEIEKFIGPFGSGRFAGDAGGEGAVDWERSEVWDSTAIVGSEKLAANIHGGVTHPSVRWFRLEWDDADLKRDKDAVEHLERVSDEIYAQLQASDFNAEVGSCYLDFTRLGNFVLCCEVAKEKERWDGLDFTAIPLRDAYFELSPRGHVTRFFQRLNWTPRQIVDRFGEGGVPEHIRLKAEQPSATEPIEVVFAVFERREFLGTGFEPDGKPKVLAPERRPIGFRYFLAGSAEQLGEDGGYYRMPVFAGGWQRAAGSQWAYGPGHLALPAVRLLNSLCEADHGSSSKAVDPPSLVDERGLLTDLDLRPGGMTVVRDVEKSIRVLDTGYRPDIADRKIFDLRNEIRAFFHVDELQLKDSPAMTATEAQIRYELMNRLLGGTLARLQSEVLDMLVMLVYETLLREGLLPEVPASVKQKAQRGGGSLKVNYLGPLSRAQRTDEVAAIERGASFVAALTKMGLITPEQAQDSFDPDSSIREVFRLLGAPANILRSERERDNRRKARVEAESRAMQAEVARAEGEALEQQAMGAQAAGLPVPASPPPVIAPTLGGGQ